MKNSKKNNNQHPETDLTTLGRDPLRYDGAVNTPVVRASTILYPTVNALRKSSERNLELHNQAENKITYGRHGTPTTYALTETLSSMDGAHQSFVFSSGKTAVLASLLAFLKKGDHMLMVDSAYGPSRELAKGLLKRFGVSTDFYDPQSNINEIAKHLKPETKVVFTESPGSLTFEIQDIPAIAELTQKSGIILITDNTWASPLYCNPINLGADVSLQAGTKYLCGHSDVMLGVVSANKESSPAIAQAFEDLGACPSPDDCYLALRGIRTLAVRLKRHEKTALLLAEWFSKRSEVIDVLHPALPNFPSHEIWKRDFSGSSGLFGIILKPHHIDSVENMLESLNLFGMGYSWGGYESLAIPTWPYKHREKSSWDPSNIYLRIHAGLEDPDDLIDDLSSGFKLLKS
tara:strand:+ start:26692 stop:27903 length:1212 start_codon:yes stop_codon:yes gene_type:complete